jgi:glucan phosphoethanolaminetransferase (alkaline phosphatase superfamily)
MTRSTTIYSLISGLVMAAMLSLSGYLMLHDKHFDSYGMAIGFAGMLLAFVFIFIAIKNRRDELDGVISFQQAFVAGLIVAVVASIFYTITWAIINKAFYPEFMDDFVNAELARMKERGKSDAEVLKAAKGLESTKAAYASWPGLIGYTLMEVLPLGIVVALIAAAILKRKRPALAVQ